MNARTFISSSFDGRDGLGMIRAERDSVGEWHTRLVAEPYDVRCLARHPQDGDQIYAGHRAAGSCAQPTQEPPGNGSGWRDRRSSHWPSIPRIRRPSTSV